MVAPLFLGPSDGLARALAACAEEVPDSFTLQCCTCLVDNSSEEHAADTRVAEALASQVIAAADAPPCLQAPLHVLLVDHGTPSVKVNAVRSRLARELSALLGDRAALVREASMERREGSEYDFNEPLLERALAAAPFNDGDVVLAMAFLSPGRHAGDGGDVMQIVENAAAQVDESCELRVRTTPPLAAHPLIVEVLASRVMEADAAAMASDGLPSQ